MIDYKEHPIEKDIPIPKPFRGRERRWEKIANQLEVGDSIFFSDEGEFNAARNTLGRYGVKLTTRRVEGGFRIWCVKGGK